MVRRDEIRTGERAVEKLPQPDAGVIFIGRIITPWTDRLRCPRQGRLDGPVCRIEVFAPWAPEGLDGIEAYERLEVLYWLHQSRRDIIRQSPADDGTARGVFSLRSPVRPNPNGTSIVRLVGREGSTLLVQGLDCLDKTPLIDVKPDRSGFIPIAPRQPGDEEVAAT